MKTNFSALLVAVAGMAMVTALFGCKPNVTTPVVPPTLPGITFSIPQPNSWYNGNDTLTVFLTNATSATIGGTNVTNGSKVIFTHLGSDTLGSDTTITCIAVNATDNASVNSTATVSIHIYSNRITLLCNYGGWKCDSIRFANVDSVSFPSAWNLSQDCNTYNYLPNGTVSGILGACNGQNSGTVASGLYTIQSKDTQIMHIGDINPYNIGILTKKIFMEYQIQVNGFDPTGPERYRLERWYSHL